MFKKGQAAMEFLMTYGWAILVVLAAIGALAYFGVLSPDNLLPERTAFQAPLAHADNAYITVSGNDVVIEIPFTNNVGYQIDSNNAGTIFAPDGTADAIEVKGTNVPCTATAVAGGGADLRNSDRFIVTWTCTVGTAPVPGDKVKATLGFEYYNEYTTQTKTHSGSVNGKVSA